MLRNSYIIPLKDLPSILGMSRTSLWKLRRQGDFPKPLMNDNKVIGWRRESIVCWLDSLQEEAA